MIKHSYYQDIQKIKNDFLDYSLKFQQFNTQILENIKNAEDTKTFDEINADFKIQNNKVSEMFTKQNEEIKIMEPCLVSLERINQQNSDLLKPIELLTEEVNSYI